MRVPKTLCLALVASALAVLAMGNGRGAVAAGTNRIVTGAGVDTGDCSTNPCYTISYAVSKAAAGDAVVVAAGTYKESVVITKSVSLQGTNAVIDATGKDNGVLVKGSAAAGTGVSGFTIQNANQEGILVMETSGVTIANNTVTNNTLGAKAKTPVGECAPQGPIPGDCGEAIHLWAVKGSTVSGNTISKNLGGILLSDETGPTSGNNILNNTISSTIEDCGITLASHYLNIGSPVAPNVAGVYMNTVSGNTISNVGPDGAGIGMYAAPPGAAAYRNTVSGNTISGTTMAGIAIHSHALFQNVNDNFIFENVLSKNGIDDDAGTPGSTGIVIFADVGAGASPIRSETISQNSIASNQIGIFQKGVLTAFGANNVIDKTVTNPSAVTIASAPAAPAAGGPPPSAGASGAAGATSAVPAVISPPNTGDGGLVRNSHRSETGTLIALGLIVLAATTLGLATHARRI